MRLEIVFILAIHIFHFFFFINLWFWCCLNVELIISVHYFSFFSLYDLMDEIHPPWKTLIISEFFICFATLSLLVSFLAEQWKVPFFSPFFMGLFSPSHCFFLLLLVLLLPPSFDQILGISSLSLFTHWLVFFFFFSFQLVKFQNNPFLSLFPIEVMEGICAGKMLFWGSSLWFIEGRWQKKPHRQTESKIQVA